MNIINKISLLALVLTVTVVSTMGPPSQEQPEMKKQKTVAEKQRKKALKKVRGSVKKFLEGEKIDSSLIRDQIPRALNVLKGYSPYTSDYIIKLYNAHIANNPLKKAIIIQEALQWVNEALKQLQREAEETTELERQLNEFKRNLASFEHTIQQPVERVEELYLY